MEIPDRPTSPFSAAQLERVRGICTSLPQVVEKISHGEPTWFAGKGKSFAMFADHHHGDRLAVWLWAADGVQSSLVHDRPDGYFKPPYVGVRGWVGAYLDEHVEVDWEELGELIEDAYRGVAIKKLLAELDARS